MSQTLEEHKCFMEKKYKIGTIENIYFIIF